MSTKTRNETGPLNAPQEQALRLLVKGFTHQQIADRIGAARVTVSENIVLARKKLGCGTVYEAIALYSAYETLMAVADQMEDPYLEAKFRAEARGLMPSPHPHVCATAYNKGSREDCCVEWRLSYDRGYWERANRTAQRAEKRRNQK